MSETIKLSKQLDELSLRPQEHRLENFETILDPNEVASALKIAEEVKRSEMRKKAYWKEIMNPKKKDLVTAEELLQDVIDICEEDGKPLVIDDENRHVVELLSWYFAGDERFTAAGYSLDKGIMLYGAVGIGKTHLMRQFTSMQRKPFRMVDCTDIVAEHKKRGDDGIEKYYKDCPIHERNYWGHTERGWCFDDLGTESDSKYYGNQTNVMERIIEMRYKSRVPVTTHIITNLNADHIQERYGLRVRERLREMVNAIHFKATVSRRK